MLTPPRATVMEAVMPPKTPPQPRRTGLLDEMSGAGARLHEEHIGPGLINAIEPGSINA